MREKFQFFKNHHTKNKKDAVLFSLDENEDMTSVSIRVRNDDGNDVVVSPTDGVENTNNLSRRNSRRDSSTPGSSIRRSRPSSTFFNDTCDVNDMVPITR
ncbi:unnamed protein product [Caenorhabditis angaria]|uniref:Uncharacterized protein n=1 Tax=Caenorhabditis angaria TaxID=860376 RepID=A0A9P1MY78_9PELO|nr:unnamed protein product [Caenorhabditis angaria]